jgi:hypothetical protein
MSSKKSNKKIVLNWSCLLSVKDILFMQANILKSHRVVNDQQDTVIRVLIDEVGRQKDTIADLQRNQDLTHRIAVATKQQVCKHKWKELFVEDCPTSKTVKDENGTYSIQIVHQYYVNYGCSCCGSHKRTKAGFWRRLWIKLAKVQVQNG